MRIAASAVLPLLLATCAPTHMNEIDDLMRDYDGDGPGAAVLVVQDGRVWHPPDR